MKRFRTLEIESNEQRLVELLIKLKNSENTVFTYQEKTTKSYANNIFAEENYVACFKTKRKSLFESSVFMVIYNGVLSITNIISPTNHNLGVEKYNSVLTFFYEEYIKPKLDGTYNVTISNDEKSMQDFLGYETFRKLELWENTCNIENPISHPSDRQRWIEFVVAAYQCENRLLYDDFAQWLKKDKKWHDALDDKIDELFHLYEYGIEILRTAHDGNR